MKDSVSELPPLDALYEIEGVLGAGGMGTVARARDRSTGELVALKRLHPHLEASAHFRNILRDEAMVQRSIRSEHVVRTIGVGTVGGEIAIVLELVRGPSLARWCEHRSEPCAPELAIEIVLQALDGLAAAHDAVDERGQRLDVVHRDVSPQNLLLSVDGVVKLTDFGVARARARLQSTGEGRVKGKLAYMSPEQIGGGALDQRSDLFSLGVVFWELLTGRRLFDGTSEGEIVRKVMAAEVPPASALVREPLAELDAILALVLAREPAARFSSAAEMAEAIRTVSGRSRAGRSALASAAAELGGPAELDGEAGRSPPRATTREDEDGGLDSASMLGARVTEDVPRASLRTAPHPSSRRAILIIVPIVVTLGAVLAWAGRATRGPASSMPVVSSPTSSSSAMPSAVVSSAAFGGASSASASAAIGSPAPTPAISRNPPGARTAADGGASTRPSSASCDPPYRVDARGVRIFRPECL